MAEFQSELLTDLVEYADRLAIIDAHCVAAFAAIQANQLARSPSSLDNADERFAANFADEMRLMITMMIFMNMSRNEIYIISSNQFASLAIQRASWCIKIK